MSTSTRDVVASFFVARSHKALRQEHGAATEKPPTAERYIAMLKVLDASCRRFGLDHVVLTDCVSAPLVAEAGLHPFMSDLPRNLMQATTEIQARWLASPHSLGCNTTFVGADCIIARDFRPELDPAADLSIAFMAGHKKWRINNGFMHVPARARVSVAPLFRLVADDTGPAMCEDMIALERALSPMPRACGRTIRRDLQIHFLPLALFNLSLQHTPTEPIENAFVLHFMGGWENGKQLFFDYAEAHGLA